MEDKNLNLDRVLRITLMFFTPGVLVSGFLLNQETLDLHEFVFFNIFNFLVIFAINFYVIKNLQNLSASLKDIAADKKTDETKFKLLDFLYPISHYVTQLKQNLQNRKFKMQSVITEREVLVDALPEMLIMITDEGKIARTNKAARSVFGQNLAGQLISDVIKNDFFNEKVNKVVKDLKGREIRFHLDEPVNKDFLSIVEKFPIPSAGGISVIITINDVTELRSLEKMRADFVANASHEIRTPLTSLKGFIETMQEQEVDEKTRNDFFKIMVDQAERMEDLIDDLLSLSKIEMNAHTLPTEKTEIKPTLRKSVNSLQSMAEKKNMNLKLDAKDNMPEIIGDSSELGQVFYNLISNAIKYGDADTEVNITAKVTDLLPDHKQLNDHSRAIVVSVADKGAGIAAEHIERLTERFFRVDKARTRKVGGTGLGLAIVKHILGRHRAVMIIESELDVGSNFSVYFPLQD